MIQYMVEGVSLLRELLESWMNRRRQASKIVRDAIGAVEVAAVATRGYIADVEQGKNNSSRRREQQLSQMWLEARQKAMEAGEYELADKCLFKADGWADRRLWRSPRFQEVPLGLDSIIEASRNLTKKLSGDTA